MLDDLDAEDRALIQELRELPSEGNEPDWKAMEASIRAQVGDRAPRPWWRNWRWIVPIWALGTTAVIALLVVHRTPEPSRSALRLPELPRVERAQPEANALWLDGDVLELEDVDEPALDDLDGAVRAALEPTDEVSDGILPAVDYRWVDTLDEEAMERADTWLKRNRS